MPDTLAAGYVRVSTEEQTEGWSLEGQEAQIREYAQRNGYQIVKLYVDDSTGSKDKRPGLEQMLIDAHNGKFQAIIIVHTSRLFRNMALARRYKDLLRNKLGVEVVFLSQPKVDPNDPTGFLMEAVNELFDEYYLHQLRFWTTLGKQTRAQKGMWNGTLPFGYVSNEEGKPVPHPKNAEGLRAAFEAYSTGRYSDKQIANLLNRLGYRTTGNWGERLFTKDTVNRILKNVFYLGKTKYKGEVLPGVHEPLISQELFDKCQEVRLSRALKPRALGEKKRVYVFSGIARCHECQLTLRCTSTMSGHKWRYYRHTAEERGYDCTVSNRLVRSDKLEEKWSQIITSIRLPEDWQKKIEDLAASPDERAAILKEQAQITEQLRRLTQLYKDLLIEERDYQESKARLQTRLISLKIPENQEIVEAGQYLESLSHLWQAATLEEQRDITRMMVKAIYIDVMAEQIVSVEPNSAFAMLLKEVCENVGVAIVT